jgi:tRNA (guanine37-N1)-methyltransferase
MRFDILTLFPEMIEGVINSSILKRAREKGLLEINIIDFRLFSTNKHNTVDDYAYGGGAGMLISVEPIHKALQSIVGYEAATKILTTPSGKVFNQKMAID